MCIFSLRTKENKPIVSMFLSRSYLTYHIHHLHPNSMFLISTLEIVHKYYEMLWGREEVRYYDHVEKCSPSAQQYGTSQQLPFLYEVLLG